MTNSEDYNNSLHFLNERAKELNCLYQVDEILNDQHLSLPEILEAIVKIIPSGWQYPEACQARIVYENQSYQSSGFFLSPYMISSNIKVDNTIIGKIQVVYTTEVPQNEEGYFLEKELKLIRTIADRIGQTILYRHMKQVMIEWNNARKELENGVSAEAEWVIILNFLCKTDQNMLLHVCRKMLNHLYCSGIKESSAILNDLSPGWSESFEEIGLNYPSAKIPLGNITRLSEKTFNLAAQYLSDGEIAIRLQKWIQEYKAYTLIRTVNRIDASVGDIIEAILRYRSIAGESSMLYYPTERWLGVALINRFLSDNLNFIHVAKKHLGINDFYTIINRLIYPADSNGRIGGKSTGLFLAEKILKKASEEIPVLESIKVPRTWYITADEMTEFLHYNNLEELNEQKYKELSEIRMDYPGIIQIMKNGSFPKGIIKSLAMALDEFDDTPIIVRSSSLLEDQTGSAFSGKYKSLFLANQGSKEERMEALMDAIIEVYASVYSPDSIKYRTERGLLDFHEEMGIMIQEVVGTKIGPYYLPMFSGVAFSNNEFRWSPRIKREDGIIRLVMGLGTRAVDRLSDDFPVLVSPGQPGLRVNTIPEEIKHYAPKKLDVINLEKKCFETIETSDFLSEYGLQITNIQNIISVNKDTYIAKLSPLEIDFVQDDLIITFEGLITDTPFIKRIDQVLKVLQDKLGTPVDIEFASDGKSFYLLQCRPQSFSMDNVPAPIPKDISIKNIIFSANRYISNGTIKDISHIVYVDPEGYQQLKNLDDILNVGRVVGLLNSLLPRKRFILMGPGRWGSRGDIKMGVQVSYADINNTAALIEIARQKSNYVPELSFGTHFFQDLVETNIRYLPLYPDNKEIIFNEVFLKRAKNILSHLLPGYSYLEEVVRVIDISENSHGKVLQITMNAELEDALGYLADFSQQAEPEYNQIIPVDTGTERFDDRFWRWRFYMAERIADQLDLNRFGVEGIYLTGSTNTSTAGPGSDIDLIIHFAGSPQQKEALILWMEGWSLCLSEANYLKTGYTSDGLLDIHFITDEDLREKTSFAVKIGGITDPAYPLKLKK